MSPVTDILNRGIIIAKIRRPVYTSAPHSYSASHVSPVKILQGKRARDQRQAVNSSMKQKIASCPNLVWTSKFYSIMGYTTLNELSQSSTVA